VFQKNVAPERTLSKFAQSCYVHVVTASRRGGNEQNRTNMMTWLSAQIDPPPESNFMAPGAAGPLSFFSPAPEELVGSICFCFFLRGGARSLMTKGLEWAEFRSPTRFSAGASREVAVISCVFPRVGDSRTPCLSTDDQVINYALLLAVRLEKDSAKTRNPHGVGVPN